MKYGPYLIISGHDFRSKRQANMHFIARELARRGTTRFFSTGFSFLSRIKDDPRLSLWSRANKVELHNGVESYLWRTPLHPFNLRAKSLEPMAAAWFRLYARQAPKILREWITETQTIILESGMAIIFFDLIKSLNPDATILYLCSDALDTIGCASYLKQELARISPLLDGIRIPSPNLLSEFPKNGHIFYIPHGIDRDIADSQEGSPYSGGINMVSVGSMLFDRTFFTIAADAFPAVMFHVIGGGDQANRLEASNIVVHGEMPFRQTLPYIKYANAGIAPYKSDNVAPYLTDTSMKLMQYGYLGIPAVCPHVVVGDHDGRFGYEPGNRESIIQAIRAALAYGHFQGRLALTWSEVTDRILEPVNYPDTYPDVALIPKFGINRT